MSKRLCPIHGLWNKNEKKTSCPLCNKNRHKEYDAHRRDPETAKFYHSAAWKRVRKTYINNHPLCERCKRTADVVDHIVEINDGGAKLSYSNLQSLCHGCHNAKTAEEKSKRGAGQISTTHKHQHRPRRQHFSESVSGGTHE